MGQVVHTHLVVTTAVLPVLYEKCKGFFERIEQNVSFTVKRYCCVLKQKELNSRTMYQHT